MTKYCVNCGAVFNTPTIQERVCETCLEAIHETLRRVETWAPYMDESETTG